MKKTLAAFAAFMLMCILTQKLQAQEAIKTTTTTQRTTFGIRGGINFFNITGKDENGDKITGNKLTPGFNAGINVEINLAPDFYFKPELLYTTKGTKNTDGSNDNDVTLNLNYLELPLNLLYKAPVGTGSVLLGFGPYVAYGLGGKAKGGGESVDVKFKNNPGTADAIYFKPFDAGANLLAGYAFTPKISAQINAQLGLANTYPYKSDTKSHNTGFGLSLDYRF